MNFFDSKFVTWAILFFVMAAILLSVCFWGELRGVDSASSTVRNIGLVVGGVIAIYLAIWRSTIAERQSEAATRQSGIAQRSLLNERYHKAAEMLDNGQLHARLGAIYAFQQIRNEHPKEYHVLIMRTLTAFVRFPTPDAIMQSHELHSHNFQPPRIRQDVQAAMEAIGSRNQLAVQIEKHQNYKPDLRRVKLCHANLENLNLSGMRLSGTDFTGSSLKGTNLFNATLNLAILNGAHLEGANFSSAKLNEAQLRNVTCLARPIEKYKAYTDYQILIQASQGGIVADFSSALLKGADLFQALLQGANFTQAILLQTNLTGADFSKNRSLPVIGLTQAQLDQAYAKEDNPPQLCDTIDAKTGKSLEWRSNNH